jgi:hypothetical protein
MYRAPMLALFDLNLKDAWPGLVAAVPLGLLLLGAANAWLSARNERRRNQPVVICHEHRARMFSRDDAAWDALVYLTNEGSGTRSLSASGFE